MSLLKRIEKNTDQGKTAKVRAHRKTSKADAAAHQRIAARIDISGRVEKRLCQELGVEALSDELLASKGATLRDLAAQFLHEEMGASLTERELVLPRAERRQLEEAIFAELFGYGPLETLLNDPAITEVFVFAPDRIWVIRKGILEASAARFESSEHLRRIIERMAATQGHHFDTDHPMLNLRLPDGSRLVAACPPVSVHGPAVTLHKFNRVPLTMQNLIDFGTLTADVAEFLQACVKARLNIIISGSHSPGKTTLLNILAGFIPDDQRIITVEYRTELQLKQGMVAALEAPPMDWGAQHESLRDIVRRSMTNAMADRSPVSMADMVRQAFNMNPDRVIVGDVRGGEASHLIQAMHTGHDGVMATIHGSSPRDTLRSLETMMLMDWMDLPVRAIREQIASAVHLIVHLDRMRDGSRKVTKVAEVQGMEGDVITLPDIFTFEQTSFDKGRAIGYIKPTGLRPKSMDRILDSGIVLPPQIFGGGPHS